MFSSVEVRETVCERDEVVLFEVPTVLVPFLVCRCRSCSEELVRWLFVVHETCWAWYRVVCTAAAPFVAPASDLRHRPTGTPLTSVSLQYPTFQELKVGCK